jgi:hypothetical protein
MRALLLAALAVAVLAAPALAAPPKMPSSTKGTKNCGQDVRATYGGHFRVYITKGRKRISCRTARSVVRKGGLNAPKGWRYWDWTKGGNRPWSDVWRRHDHRVVIGAIITCYEGAGSTMPCHETNPH